MSMIKRMPKTAWFIAGALVAVLLVPATAAVAKGALKYTGIEGVSNGTGGINGVDVTGAGQILATDAEPNRYINATTEYFVQNAWNPVYSPPVGRRGIVNDIHVDVSTLTAAGGAVIFTIHTGSCSTGTGTPVDYLDFNEAGMTVLPYTPGLIVPAGASLCGLTNEANRTETTVTGYTIVG